MAFDHRESGRVCYWPTRRLVDAPHGLTPSEAWQLLLRKAITPATFGRVLDAWDKVLRD